jgi:hypothetical protein
MHTCIQRRDKGRGRGRGRGRGKGGERKGHRKRRVRLVRVNASLLRVFAYLRIRVLGCVPEPAGSRCPSAFPYIYPLPAAPLRRAAQRGAKAHQRRTKGQRRQTEAGWAERAEREEMGRETRIERG